MAKEEATLSHSDPRHQSDALLDALDALKRTEARRHREPIRSPLFHALAAEADAHRRRIFRIATELEPASPDDGSESPTES